MSHATPIASALGGALIGLAATIVLAVHGKVAGISGIFGGLLRRDTTDRDFRLAFVLGLFGGGLVLSFAMPGAFPQGVALSSPLVVVVAGLLVGYGTRLGNGCTSGHGVSGLSRLSFRSLVATLVFMGVAIVTTYLVRHVGAS